MFKQFSTLVKEIHSLPNNRWSITSVHIPSKVETTKDYDAVIVCSGHFNVGSYPQIPGRESFAGKQLHSHDYREPEPYKGKKILVIGAGPSGLDLTAILSKHAQSVSFNSTLSKYLQKKSFFVRRIILNPSSG